MEKRIILIQGMHDTLDVFSNDLKKYLEKMNYEIFILDVKDIMTSLSNLHSFIQKPVLAVITYNNVGMLTELVPRKKIWDELEIPCIDILVDHPYNYMEELKNAPRNTSVICVDYNHVCFVKRFFKNIRKVFFMPHPGIEEETKEIPWKQRSIEVMYAGSLSRDVAMTYIPEMKSEIFDAERMCNKVLEALIKNPKMPYENALENYLKEIGLEISDEKLCQLIRKYRFLDPLTVSFYRERLIEILLNSGIRVTLFGSRWENCKLFDHPNLDYRGYIAPRNMMKVMKDSKIILNSMPGFKDGAHERIFYGMLAKSIVVSDKSRYLERELGKTNTVYLYSLREQEKLPEKVKWYLNHPKDAAQMAKSGYSIAKEQYTSARWADFIDLLLEQ